MLVSIIAVAVAIPAIAIPLAVGIPLGIAGGDDFDDYTGFAPTASIPIPSFASPPAFVGAPAFRPAPTFVTGPAVGGATAFGTAPVGGVTALETAPAFVGAPPPGQHAVFIDQPFTNRRGDSSPDQLSHSVEKSDYSSQEERCVQDSPSPHCLSSNPKDHILSPQNQNEFLLNQVSLLYPNTIGSSPKLPHTSKHPT